MTHAKQNLLSRWKRHFDSLSSPLMLRPTLDRKFVDFIHMILLNFWGLDFFYIDFIQVMQDNELHFIQSLVYKSDKASFYRALEVCFLIDYGQSKNVRQYEKLKSVKLLSEQVRDVLCELLVEFAFNEAGFLYEANAKRGVQVLEGYCTVKDERFLVECKNKYSMTEDQFKVIRAATARVSGMIRDIQPQLEYIGAIHFDDKDIKSHQLHKPLQDLEKFLSSCVNYHPQTVIRESGVTIEILPGTPDNLLRFDNQEIRADLCFSYRNTFELGSKGQVIYRLQVYHQGRTGRNDVSKRLVKTVKEARKQHQKENCFGRIICIFNEFYNDLRPPLLVNTEDFVPDVEKYLGGRSTKDIVVLVDRRFNLGLPQIQYFVIGNTTLKPFKNELCGRLDFSIFSKWPDAAVFFEG